MKALVIVLLVAAALCGVAACSTSSNVCQKFTTNLGQGCDAIAAACRMGTGFMCSVVPDPPPTPVGTPKGE